MKRVKKILNIACIGALKLYNLYDIKERVLILYYHSINKRLGKYYYLKTPPDVFKKQMNLIKDCCQVISLNELVKKVKHGQKIKDCVIITFDDGFKDNYTTAYPILYKYDLPATFFITTSFVGKKGYMEWKNVRELAQSGFDIGSHGVTHRKLSALSLHRVEEELKFSKEIIEAKIHKSINLFAAPYGDKNSVNLEIINLVKKYYDCCCLTQGFFGLNPERIDLYQLKRIPVPPSVSEFKAITNKEAGLWLWLYEKLITIKSKFNSELK